MGRRAAPPLRITERADYALKSVLLLCLHQDQYLTVTAIADHYGMSQKMLGAVLWSLREGGIVSSRPGWHGGFRLARPPREIALRSVIASVIEEGVVGSQKDAAGTTARNGRSARGGRPADLVAEFWRSLDDHVQGALGRFTLADLAAEEVFGDDRPERRPASGPRSDKL